VAAALGCGLEGLASDIAGAGEGLAGIGCVVDSFVLLRWVLLELVPRFDEANGLGGFVSLGFPLALLDN
jgi:hypothetical protein